MQDKHSDFKESYSYTDSSGTYYFKDAEKKVFHRIDGPAVEYIDGSYSWYRYGSLHRIGGPAYKSSFGDLFWYRNGHKHNDSGPAVLFNNNTNRKEWWINGKRHRVDGPAIETNYILEWWFNGKRHRLDGPAYIDTSVVHLSIYFVDGIRLTKEEWLMMVPEDVRSKILFDSNFICKNI